MNKKIKNNIFIILTLILSAFMFLSSSCFAVEDGQVPDSFESEIRSWLKNDGKTITRIAYGEGKQAYVLDMPDPKGKHITGDDYGNFHYQFETDNYNVDIKLNVDTEVKINTGGKYPALDNMSLGVSDIVATNDGKYQRVIEGIDYQDGNAIIKAPDGTLISIPENELDNYLQIDHTSDYTKDNYTQTPKSEDPGNTPETPPEIEEVGPITETVTPTKIKTKRVGIIDWLKNILETIKDYLKDILSRIFSFILLAIADGLKGLIDYAVGENVTLASIIFNHTQKMTIDYWSIPKVSASQRANLAGDAMLLQTSVAGILKPVVSYWFTRLRGIAILCYFVLLLYLGLRIVLASTAMNLEATKERLMVWISGLLVLLTFPYLMKYTVQINNAVVKAIENKGVLTTQVTIEQEVVSG